MENTKTLTPEATRLLDRTQKKVGGLKKDIAKAKDKVEANGFWYSLEWGTIEAIVKAETMVANLENLGRILGQSNEPYEGIVGYCKKVAMDKLMSRAWAGSPSLGHNFVHLIRHDAAVEFIKWLDENA